jgi:hypothetical protein
MAVRPTRPDIRVSDADRTAAAEALRRHCLAGRLSIEELDERLAEAYAARTEGELAELVQDLPPEPETAVAAVPVPTPPRRRLGLPGVRPFFQRHDFDLPRTQIFEEAMAHIVPAMIGAGYDLAERDEPRLLVFETEERPAWVLAACVFAFPIGLVALTVRHTYRIAMAFDDMPDGGTEVTVQGSARRPVRRSFAELSD